VPNGEDDDWGEADKGWLEHQEYKKKCNDVQMVCGGTRRMAIRPWDKRNKARIVRDEQNQ